MILGAGTVVTSFSVMTLNVDGLPGKFLLFDVNKDGPLSAGSERISQYIAAKDCDIVSMKNMLAGKQTMSIFKDTRTLAERTVIMVNDILAGKKPETNSEYDNKAKQVPSYLCDPVFADINNYKTILIDSGYYSEADLA